jgi:hypothetical protein
VKVEALGQRVTLTGLGRLDHMTVLWVDEALVETADVLNLPALERGSFTASQPGDGIFDCSVLAGCESLRWLTVRGPRAVVNVDAVLALPQLERFAIIGGDKPRATSATSSGLVVEVARANWGYVPFPEIGGQRRDPAIACMP